MNNTPEKPNPVSPKVWLTFSLIVFVPMAMVALELNRGESFLQNASMLTKLILFIAALFVVVNIWRVVKKRLK